MLKWKEHHGSRGRVRWLRQVLAIPFKELTSASRVNSTIEGQIHQVPVPGCHPTSRAYYRQLWLSL